MKQTIVEKKKEVANGCAYYEDKEELEATRNRNKSADEMFEELGYTEIWEEYNYFVYASERGEKGYIRFETEEKTICPYNSIYGGEFIKSISIQELQAINKKVQELGW